jgi:hypothetical protein
MTRPPCSEQSIQAAVVDHLAWRSVPNCFWFAVPNGGWRSKIEAKIFQGQGVTPGVPDLILLHDGKCFGLELKSNTGRTTPIQRECHARMRAAGCYVATSYGVDESIKQLERWGLLRGAAS